MTTATAAPRARRGQPAVAPALADHPRAARDLLVQEPQEAGAPWVVQRGDRFARLGADAARLLRDLDGSRSHAEIAAGLGGGSSVAQVTSLLTRFHDLGFLDDGAEAPRQRRLQFRAPASVQLTLADPSRLLGPIVRLLGALTARAAFGLVALVGSLGLMALSVQSADVVRVLAEPLPWSTYVLAYAGLLVLIALHELAHGATLMSYGGRPRRMGVMLFYFNPAFFCDVSDGWRLSHPRQRVNVALAGIGLQVLLGGVLAVAAGPVGGSAQHVLLLVAILSYVYGVFNLVPLVKFDGYIALMTHVDVPHLRDKAMADARAFLLRPLGGQHRRQLPGLGWAVPYGLACMLFPLYLIGTALTLWLGMLLSFGSVGAVIGMSLVASFAFYLVQRLLLLLATARTAGASAARRSACLALVVAAVAAVLTQVQVPDRLTGGYYTVDGEVRLVLARQVGGPDVPAGTAVALRTQGLLVHRTTATGAVGALQPALDTAPFRSLAPITGVEGDLPVWTYALDAEVADGRDHGQAVVRLPDAPLGTWLWSRYVTPGLRAVGAA